MQGKSQTLLLLRWVLVISTSYLVLFSRPLTEVPGSAALFVIVYLASNLILGALIGTAVAQRFLDTGVIVFDTLAVSVVP